MHICDFSLMIMKNVIMSFGGIFSVFPIFLYVRGVRRKLFNVLGQFLTLSTIDCIPFLCLAFNFMK